MIALYTYDIINTNKDFKYLSIPRLFFELIGIVLIHPEITDEEVMEGEGFG